MAGNIDILRLVDRAPRLLGGKLPESSPLTDLLCSNCRLPVFDAQQTIDCGCRLCGTCYSLLRDNGEKTFTCGKCGCNLNIHETFRDKAIENELKRSSFPCYNSKCPWVGSSTSYRDHVANCKFPDVTCPNVGCDVYIPKPELEEHLKSCQYRMIKCRWCKENIPAKRKQEHEAKQCPEYKIICPNGCEQKFPRKMIGDHLSKECKKQKRQCLYSKHGCTFKGTYEQLNQHYHTDSWRHLEMLEKAMSTTSGKSSPPLQQQRSKEYDQKLLNVHSELITLREEMNCRLNPLSENMVKIESAIHDFQDSFQELALLVQTLQATSYNGSFVWKIPEVTRRRSEALSGKTISLYSAPFYTSRFGYKLCLRLYMDGDGSGKGTHLSFFLTIMKGEYDALLPWPFNQMVTLMLLDQSGNKKHIIQCFKPEPTSSSFWRPQSEMNVASGCPKFASLSVLCDSDYVKDDTIFFKASVDLAGLNQH